MPGYAIGAIGAALLGGLFGSSGQSSANKTNIKLNRENRAWMEQMSNTSYQRGTKDMLAAGLNPMLAYSQGGASTPSNSAATVENAKAPLAAGITSAGTRAMAALQADNLRADTKVKDNTAEGIAIDNTKKGSAQFTPVNPDGTPKLDENGKPIKSVWEAEWDKIRADSNRARTEADAAELELRIAKEISGATISSAKHKEKILEKEVGIQGVILELKQLDLPEAKAMAAWFETVGAASPAAKAVMSISNWIKFFLRK